MSQLQIINFLDKQYKLKAVSEGDFMVIVWTGLVAPVDLSSGDAGKATQNLLDQLKVGSLLCARKQRYGR